MRSRARAAAPATEPPLAPPALAALASAPPPPPTLRTPPTAPCSSSAAPLASTARVPRAGASRPAHSAGRPVLGGSGACAPPLACHIHHAFMSEPTATGAPVTSAREGFATSREKTTISVEASERERAR
eukprot:2363427-Rhodomonas_salina.1